MKTIRFLIPILLAALVLISNASAQQYGSIWGSVTSDCDGPLAGIQIDLFATTGYYVAYTDETGTFIFPSVGIDPPVFMMADLSALPGYEAISPPGWFIDLPFPGTEPVDFLAACPAIGRSVSGTVAYRCGGTSPTPLDGVPVHLDLGDGTILDTFSSAPNGEYRFSDIVSTNMGRVWIDVPENTIPFLPPTGSYTINFINNQTRDFHVACPPETTCFYFEDFNAADHGWVPIDLSCREENIYWHVADAAEGGGGSHGQRAWWCGTFDNCAVLSTPPGYGPNWSQFLTKSFTVPAAPVSLDFLHQYDTEADFDFCKVNISTNGGQNWETLAVYSGTSDGYVPESISLSSYEGQEMMIRFAFHSDRYADDSDGRNPTNGAWRIDEVQVTGLPKDDFEEDGNGWEASLPVEGVAHFWLDGEDPSDPPDPPDPPDPCNPPSPPTSQPHPHGYYWVAYDPETGHVPFNTDQRIMEGRYVRVGIESPWIDIPTDALGSYLLSFCLKAPDGLLREEMHFFGIEILVDAGNGCERVITEFHDHIYLNEGWTEWLPFMYDFTSILPIGTPRLRIRLVYMDYNGLTDTPLGPNSTQADEFPSAGVFFDNVLLQAVNTEAPGIELPYGLTCPRGCQEEAPELITISGTVHAPCIETVEGITLDLLTPASDYLTVITDADGNYTFPYVISYADSGEVSVTPPLGTECTTPTDGHTAVSLSESQTGIDFYLECTDPEGPARTIGYWKHQASVYLNGRGRPQETEANMRTGFPNLIFEHFHNNELNAIAVEGVTYISAECPLPITIETIQSTLTVNQGGTMLDRAKQQYLALLLNLASGKLLTSSIVSEDGASASQAVQQVAYYINDMDPANDEIAKDISDTINNGQEVPAGVIDLDFENIPYRQPTPIRSLDTRFIDASPTPFRVSTRLRFDLAGETPVSLRIYSISGRLVRNLVSERLSGGHHEASWDGRDDGGSPVSPGVYYAKLSAGGRSEVRAVVRVQ